MSAYSLVGLTYLNTKGQKKKVKAGRVFDDYQEDDLEDWKERGWARDAKVGEIAEAAAQDEAAEPAEKKKRAKAAGSSKPKKAAAGSTTDQGDEDLA